VEHVTLQVQPEILRILRDNTATSQSKTTAASTRALSAMMSNKNPRKRKRAERIPDVLEANVVVGQQKRMKPNSD
jgi:hypothetical protein